VKHTGGKQQRVTTCWTAAIDAALWPCVVEHGLDTGQVCRGRGGSHRYTHIDTDTHGCGHRHSHRHTCTHKHTSPAIPSPHPPLPHKHSPAGKGVDMLHLALIMGARQRHSLRLRDVSHTQLCGGYILHTFTHDDQMPHKGQLSHASQRSHVTCITTVTCHMHHNGHMSHASQRSHATPGGLLDESGCRGGKVSVTWLCHVTCVRVLVRAVRGTTTCCACKPLRSERAHHCRRMFDLLLAQSLPAPTTRSRSICCRNVTKGATPVLLCRL